ncbi:hypothetical protein BH20ACT13_BH20ACT13_14840 [soil metagenome]
MRGRRSEQGHDRIADELLHGAAVAFELRAEALVVRGEQSLDVLGVELLGALGEADEVAEDDRHDLPFSALCGHRQALFASSRSPRSMKGIAPTDR